MTAPEKVTTALFNRRMLICVFTGFSSGLPLYLLINLIPAWLRSERVDLKSIGLFALIQLPFTWKFLWSPLVDRYALPVLGRRRSWMFLTQLLLLLSIPAFGALQPAMDLWTIAYLATAVAFFSATQDIALDAYRIESAAVTKQGALAAMYQTGYRLAMIWAGAGVLWIAAGAAGAVSGYSAGAWTTAYLAMAASMGIGIAAVLLSPEPRTAAAIAVVMDVSEERRMQRLIAWLRTAVVGPFVDFIRRYRWQALLLLALIATYRISDVVMGIMANPFYVDMGYSKEEVATVSKLYGVVMTLAGAFIGGALALRFGVMRILMVGAVLSAASNLLFAWLATRGHDLTGLVFVISADNLSAGIASAAFIAYLSGLTNIEYSATQYALFSSVMLLLPKFVAGFSGVFVDAHGYAAFFHATAALGVPVLLLIWLAGRVVPAAPAGQSRQPEPSR